MATFFKTDAFEDSTCKASYYLARSTSKWTLITYLLGASVLLVGWSIIEPGMYLIAACLLSMRPIFARISQRWPRFRLYRVYHRKSGYSRSGGQSLSLHDLRAAQSRRELAERQGTKGDKSTRGCNTQMHQDDVGHGPVHLVSSHENLFRSDSRAIVSDTAGLVRLP